MWSLCVWEGWCVGIGDFCFLCCMVCVHVIGSLCVCEGVRCVGIGDFFVFCVAGCVYT